MSEQSLAIRQALGVERLAEHLYRSGYWTDARSQSQAIVKILAGAELDIGPISSMNGVYVIEGKTSLAAQLIGSRIQTSGRYRYRVVEHDDEHCIIDFFEIVGSRREKLGTSKFDMEDAKKAGLLDRRGGMWTKYPRNMVFSRALSNGAKWYTPDVFHGPIYTPDELGAEVNESGYVVEEAPAEPYVPTRERDAEDSVPPDRVITSADDKAWKSWERIRNEAMRYRVGSIPVVGLPVGYQLLVAEATRVKAETDARKAMLAEQDAAREPWAENRRLMDQAYAAGLRLRDLPSSASRDEVEQRNGEIRQALDQQAG